MVRYAAKTLFGWIATLLATAVLIFVFLDLLPGDPARFMLGSTASADAVAALQLQMGGEQSVVTRFLGWLGGLLTGNLGISPALNAPVGELIAGRLAVTVPLVVIAMLVAIGVGGAAGYFAALKEGSPGQRALVVVGRLGAAVPSFWLGLMLVVVFSAGLRWLPPGGFVPWGENVPGALSSLLLPALALGLPTAAVLALATHDELAATRKARFTRTAIAEGLTPVEALRRHGVPNALLPLLRTFGAQCAVLIAGSVIVESVFYLPGLGRLILDAIAQRDLIVVRPATLVLVMLATGAMFLSALTRGWFDPRINPRVLR